MAAIRTEQLTKIFGGRRRRGQVRAVDQLSLEVAQGRAFAFLGPNGAGKTTTIYMLLGLRRPSSGRGEVFGQPLGSIEANRRIGFLPEDMRPKSYYTVEGMLGHCARLYGIPEEARAERIGQALSVVQLQEVRTRRTSQLSKGMVQRLGLAQALLNDPDLLILDEPTSNLDPVGRRDVMNLVEQLKSQGKTVFISSHVLSEVESVCDDVAIIDRGRLVRQGVLSELMGKGSGWEITTQTLSAAAAEEIARLEGRIETRADGTTLVQVADEEAQRRVVAILVKSGHAIVATNQCRSTLEQVFLEALTEEQP